ncbi:hypothetical protein [Clostridium sp. 19966]
MSRKLLGTNSLQYRIKWKECSYSTNQWNR